MSDIVVDYSENRRCFVVRFRGTVIQENSDWLWCLDYASRFAEWTSSPEANLPYRVDLWLGSKMVEKILS